MKIRLQPLDFLQHVVVDSGVAEDADQRCQLLHQVSHQLVLASRRTTRNTQGPQDGGIDAVTVALDDWNSQPRTRVHDVLSLIHREPEEDVVGLDRRPDQVLEVLQRELLIY